MSAIPEFKGYAQVEAWLLSITDYERTMGTGAVRYDTRTFDIEHFRGQLAGLGDPHLRYAVIHVAGTKGKGSTCAFLESALRHCGYKTGLYTSPHLYRFTERIRVNGEEIPDADFGRLIHSTASQLAATPPDSENGHPQRSFRTVFEILTASAFLYFAEQEIDIAIIETGLGGRLDSTNVFDRPGEGPLINVITAIGLDHTAILGNTIEAIATEKAGIIRSHAAVVVGEQLAPETEVTVTDVINRRCRAVNASAVMSAAKSIALSPEPGNINCWNYRWLPPATSPLAKELSKSATFCPALEGEHQARNVATALTALVQLEKLQANIASQAKPPVLTLNHIRRGIENTIWPGRFQVVQTEVPVIVDGAHCALSAAALARALVVHFPDKPAVIITGFLKDKAGEELLSAFAADINVFHAIALPPPTPRAVDIDHVRQALEKVFNPDQVTTSETINQALAEARQKAAAVNGYVVIFGSLYHIGPALDILQN